MVQTHAILVIFVFCNLFSFLSLPCIASASNGFVLKLIHRDSPLSPLYQANLSNFERFKTNVETSKSRDLYFYQWSEIGMDNSKSLEINDSIWLPLKYYEPLFTVELGIGNPIYNTTLIFDTGSSLTWTQSKPCIKCFKQDEPLFDSKKSSTYKSLTKKHPLAKVFTCYAFRCYYDVVYYSGQFSVGIASTETFTFQTTNGFPYQAPGLVFGRGLFNLGPLGSSRAVTGILGMNKEPVSFVRQLGDTIKERFSYCFPTFMSSQTKPSYLKFGDEAIIRGKKIQTTPFLKSITVSHYRLKLTDISIGRKRLRLPEGTFPGDCLIDSGASVSLLQEKVYFDMQEWFINYFSRFNITRMAGDQIPKQFLCFNLPKGFTKFPKMTYYFQKANLDIPPANLYVFEGDMFCLAMIASKTVTILGAYQQQNLRFVYDLETEMLSFAKEDCSRDAA